MTDTIRESKKQRIMSLLAKAEDSAATEAEAEAFRGKAYELIAKYGLDQAKLRAEMGAKSAHDELLVKSIFLKGKYLTDQQLMLNGIGKAIHVQLVHRRKGKDGSVEVLAFGYESDIERLEMLFSSLWLQASAKVAKTPTPFGENRVRFVKSFLIHFLTVVHERLVAAEKKAYDEDESLSNMTVVLRDRDSSAIHFMHEWLAQRGARLSDSRASRYGSGKNAGTAAGCTADIGQTKVTGGRRQIGTGRS